MHVILNNSGVLFNGRQLGGQLDGAAMAALVGTVVRTRDISMHPRGVRRVHVSESGIVWYVDYPEDRVSHFFLAVVPEDTPEQPAIGFTGAVHLNGVELSKETSESTFPYDGEVQVSGHHHIFSLRSTKQNVHFGFRRARNRRGKRSGAYKLAWVEVGFRQSESGAARMAAYRNRVEIRNAVKGRHR